jgi:16S rRNA processing protein RimM
VDPDQVVVAEILRARGNKGEVLVRSQTDVPGRLENLRSASLRLPNGGEITVEVEEAWPFKEGWVMKFAGVDSIDAAEKLGGADICIPRAERGALPEGEYFRSDLLGCEVWDKASGRNLGEVTGWQEYGGPALLEVKSGGREVLVPFVPLICTKVDVAAKRIEIDAPEGLLEL